jgi:aminoglycoside phosphotransferase (APT) family kinase protein
MAKLAARGGVGMNSVPAAGVAAAIDALGLARPVVTPLAGGILNRSFRVREGDEDLVLKLAGNAAPALGASRRSEFEMQALAAGAGLAPPVVLADEAKGFIVSRHAAGRTPSAGDMNDTQLLARVGAWIATLHALPLPDGLAVVDFGERAAGYLSRLQDSSAGGFAGRLADELAARRAALPRPAQLAACHHDLHHRNFIDDGRQLLAVDWEYAGPGDPAADLASCIGYHGLRDDGVDALLAGYGQDGAGLRERVARLAWIFDCLWFGWNAAAGLSGSAPDAHEQARLAARLLQ